MRDDLRSRSSINQSFNENYGSEEVAYQPLKSPRLYIDNQWIQIIWDPIKNEKW